MKIFIPGANRRLYQSLGIMAGLVLLVSSILLSRGEPPSPSEIPEAEPPSGEIKLLMIGNSFADCAAVYLPELAEAGGKKLVLCKANLGGSSLKVHVDALQAHEANANDPKGRPYDNVLRLANQLNNRLSLRQLLTAEKWDDVTIQQYSVLSYKPETYEPYAGLLVKYIHQYAPSAHILVHETWAYREDSPTFTDRNAPLTQQQMYEGLKSAYTQLAERYHLAIIPVGDAFQEARATSRWHFSYPDPSFDYDHPVPEKLPVQTGSLNVGWQWSTEAKTGVKTLGNDTHHANKAGDYLAGAVFYEALFNDSVEKVSFCPNELSSDDAADLRRIAHETVMTSPISPH